MKERISFLVPAFNAAGFLEKAVGSILDGNLSDGDEIIIIDDGSTDDTASVIERLKKSHPAIQSARHRINKGSAAAARNTGVDASSNDLFFCLDADNLLQPRSVPVLRQYLLDEKLDGAAFQKIDYFGSGGPKDLRHTWTFKAGLITLADALSGHFWPGPSGNYLYTKRSWLAAGRYDEGVGGGIDSWAFAISQLCTGAKFATLPETSYLHKFGHVSASVLDVREGGQSIKALRVLLPHLDLLEEESVDYLLSKEGRNQWHGRLEQRPLKVRGGSLGGGGVVKHHKQKFSLVRSLRFRIGTRIVGS